MNIRFICKTASSNVVLVQNIGNISHLHTQYGITHRYYDMPTKHHMNACTNENMAFRIGKPQ